MTGAHFGQAGNVPSIDIVLSMIVAAIILCSGRKPKMQSKQGERICDQLVAL